MNYFKRLSCLPWFSRENQGFLSAQQCSSRKLLLIAISTVFAIVPTLSQAASFIGARTDLQGSDRVDWSSLGVTPTFKVLPNNFSATSQALDNSAQFLGIKSDTADISKLVFNTSAEDSAFGINTLSIQAKAEPKPEPDSSVLITLGFIWLGLVAIRCTWFGLLMIETKRKI